MACMSYHPAKMPLLQPAFVHDSRAYKEIERQWKQNSPAKYPTDSCSSQNSEENLANYVTLIALYYSHNWVALWESNVIIMSQTQTQADVISCLATNLNFFGQRFSNIPAWYDINLRFIMSTFIGFGRDSTIVILA